MAVIQNFWLPSPFVIFQRQVRSVAKYLQCTMNKAGSNSGHLRKKLNVQKINFFYFFLDLNTIWEGPKAKKPIEIPYKPVYAS